MENRYIPMVLEPLSEATGNQFTPLVLKSSDHLRIRLSEAEHDKNGRVRKPDRFIVKAICCHPLLPYEEEDENVYTTAAGNKVKRDSYTIPSTEADKRWYRRVPESKYNMQDNTWELAVTDFTCIVINYCWPKDKLIFLDEYSEVTFEYLLKRFFLQDQRARMVAEFRANKTVPPDPKGYLTHSKYPLEDYQKVGLFASLNLDGYALFFDKGLGKTATAVNKICYEAINQPEDKMLRALIVVPNQVRTNWQEEFRKFSTCPGKTMIIKGTAIERVKQLAHAIKSEPDLYYSAVIVGYDTLSASIDAFKMIPWDSVICDESHYFKSTKTNRFDAIRQIREVSSKRLILTGTPVANSIKDLYAQLEFLSKGMSGFSDYKHFKKYHEIEIEIDSDSGSTIKKLVGVKNIPLLQERLARVSMILSKEEAGLHLPDKVYDIFEVEMTPKQAKLYEKVATELTVELKEMLDNRTESTKSLTINHVLTSLMRLAQITSGHIRWDARYDLDTGELISEATVEQISDPNPKVEGVLEILAQDDKECKAIIWATFVEDIRHLYEVLTAKGIKCGHYYGATTNAQREENVRAFNNDEDFRVLIANPKTAGEGLNLLGYNPNSDVEQSTYCGREIFFSQNWSPVERSQAEDRAHRRGTKMPVQITDLVIPGTIDSEIRKRVNEKQAMADSITDVKDILESVLEYDGFNF